MFYFINFKRPIIILIFQFQLFQRTSTEPGTEPEPLTIPGCDHACPLDKFIDLLKPVTPENYKAECRVSDPNYVVPAAPPA